MTKYMSTCLSRQKFCRDKRTFVATKDVFCCDKHVFVATKMILAAAPASDTWGSSRHDVKLFSTSSKSSSFTVMEEEDDNFVPPDFRGLDDDVDADNVDDDDVVSY